VRQDEDDRGGEHGARTCDHEHGTVGAALVIAGTGPMLAAAIVLIVSDRTKASAAVKQGTLPLIGLALLALASL
ncbi:MAG TPA: DUF1304 family protein, partial [Demequina sp.]|nr:DUF1304 family protein [Demequina sp.]